MQLARFCSVTTHNKCMPFLLVMGDSRRVWRNSVKCPQCEVYLWGGHMSSVIFVHGTTMTEWPETEFTEEAG